MLCNEIQSSILYVRVPYNVLLTHNTNSVQENTTHFFSISTLLVNIVSQAVHDSDGIDPLQGFNVLLGNLHFCLLVLDTVNCGNCMGRITFP